MQAKGFTVMAMTLEQALAGTAAPQTVQDKIQLVTVPFIDFEGRPQAGQLVVNKSLAGEVEAIFKRLAELKFPIEKMVPISAYSWADERSMADNNSSAFNYRLISGTNTPSWHGLGRAIDLNPRVNPYFGYGGVEPNGAAYDVSARGALVAGSDAVAAFEAHGWEWLGHRAEYPDYQHFQKAAATASSDGSSAPRQALVIASPPQIW